MSSDLAPPTLDTHQGSGPCRKRISAEPDPGGHTKTNEEGLPNMRPSRWELEMPDLEALVVGSVSPTADPCRDQPFHISL